MLLYVSSSAGTKKIIVNCSEPDAEIFANGQLVGKGKGTAVLLAYTDMLVECVKTGFLVERMQFYNKPNSPIPPKTYFIKMRPDDAFEASIKTDVANIDIELKTSKSEDEAWLLINKILLSYIDVIEVTDKSTGYIRTAWAVQNFTQATIRTRIIVKMGDKNPLSYKLKLVCEYSKTESVSAKDDQSFKEWNRVLRKYEPIVTEMPSRLK